MPHAHLTGYEVGNTLRRDEGRVGNAVSTIEFKAIAGRIARAEEPVDTAQLLKSAQLPARKDRLWHVELAPLTRMDAWRVAPLTTGQEIALIGYTFDDVKRSAHSSVPVLASIAWMLFS